MECIFFLIPWGRMSYVMRMDEMDNERLGADLPVKTRLLYNVGAVVGAIVWICSEIGRTVRPVRK